MVKVAKTELLQIETAKQTVYLEQEFKLTKETNFKTLRDMCCDFWGLKRENYSLYDSKFGHLMALNLDDHHPAHTVSNYFEVLKMRYPSLFLLKDEVEKAELFKNPAQKQSVTIDGPKGKGSGAGGFLESDDKKKDKEAEIMARNFKLFNRTFPGQQKYMLDKEKRSTRIDISLLPDTYFVTFIVNLLLIVAVLIFFFNTRTVSEEFYIRKNILNVFEKTFIQPRSGGGATIDMQPFSQVSSTDNFIAFLNQTVPYSVFTDDTDAKIAFS